MGATGSRRSDALRALRYRDFRLIAIGNMVSQLGFWGQYVAVGWIAHKLTNSNFLVTVAFASQWLPSLFLSPFAGVLADRFDRRRLVLLGNLAMVLPPLVIGFLVQQDLIELWSLIGLVVLGGVGQTFTQPATAAYVPALVPPEDLHSAIALNAGMSNSTRVIGPALAGILISNVDVSWGFYVNAVSFLAVTGACMMVRTRPPSKAANTTSMGADLRLGVAYTRQNPAVGRLILLMGVVAFWMMQAALMPIFAADVLHGTASTYGLLSSGPGIGFVGAAILTPLLTLNAHRMRALLWCASGLAVALFVISVSRSVPLTVAALGFHGFCYMVVTTLVTTLLLAASDDEYRGRVMGLFGVFSVGVFPINSVLAGALSSVLGAPGTLLLCSAATLVFLGSFVATGSMKVIRAGTDPDHVMAVA